MEQRTPRRRRRPPAAASVQLTDRDLVLLAYAAEHRFVTTPQLAVLLDSASADVDSRVESLCDGGYLRTVRPLTDQPAFHQVRAAGLRAAGSDLPTPRPPDLSAHRHDLGLGWLMLAAQRGRFGPVRSIVSERRMRSDDGRLRADDDWAGDRAARFGVRLGGVGPGGRERLHYPDLLIETAGGERVAFELELTGKGRDRRERILAAYASDARIDAVVYLVENPQVGQAIERSAARVGTAHRVLVGRVRIDGPAPGRADGARQRHRLLTAGETGSGVEERAR